MFEHPYVTGCQWNSVGIPNCDTEIIHLPSDSILSITSTFYSVCVIAKANKKQINLMDLFLNGCIKHKKKVLSVLLTQVLIKLMALNMIG